MLYGDAFSPDAGRCFRWVYRDDTTQPMRCREPVRTRGWWRDRAGVWWAVDACREHAGALDGRPGPGARIGLRTVPPPAGRRVRPRDGLRPRDDRDDIRPPDDLRPRDDTPEGHPRRRAAA